MYTHVHTYVRTSYNHAAILKAVVIEPESKPRILCTCNQVAFDYNFKETTNTLTILRTYNT